MHITYLDLNRTTVSECKYYNHNTINYLFFSSSSMYSIQAVKIVLKISLALKFYIKELVYLSSVIYNNGNVTDGVCNYLHKLKTAFILF